MFHLSLGSFHTDIPTVVAAAFVLVVLVYLVPYLADSHSLRSYPGPLIAKFSDAWLVYVTYNEHRSEVVHNLHMKYGQSGIDYAHSSNGSSISVKVPSFA